MPAAPSPSASPSRSTSASPSASPSSHSSRRRGDREKLAKYRQLKCRLSQDCSALQTQLLQTTQQLQLTDMNAGFKIDVLQSELRETRVGMDSLLETNAAESVGQAACIRALGKKLIKQAHKIKRQKMTVDDSKVRVEALQEEMAMQDERDLEREDHLENLQGDYDSLYKHKLALQTTLQENMEEMMELRTEHAADATNATQLQTAIKEQTTDLEVLRRQSHDQSKRITLLEKQMADKTQECDILANHLKTSNHSAHVMKMELERTNHEMDDLRDRTNVNVTQTTNLFNPTPTASAKPRRTLWGNYNHGGGNNDPETLKNIIRDRDRHILAMDRTILANNASNHTLKSDMVKMSSTYKQEDYLKRNQITKLKRVNAEYALKLQALEKAFRGINEQADVANISERRDTSPSSSRRNQTTGEC